jgi:DNA-binding MarR family transcriptional regulator
MHPLTGLGISDAAMRTYVDLVEHGAATPAELAGRTGWAPGELDPLLTDLRHLGLVESRADLVLPVPPHLALEELAQQRARQAALAREVAGGLSQLWARGAGQNTYLEVLPSPEAARAVLDRVQVDVREQVRAMTVDNLASNHHTIVGGLFEALARAVRYQVIYGTSVLHDPEARRMVARFEKALGEDRRPGRLVDDGRKRQIVGQVCTGAFDCWSDR